LEAERVPSLEPIANNDLTVPTHPGKILAIALNYLDHARESGHVTPDHPLVLAKLPSSVIGHGQPIAIDEDTMGRVDWEGELAVVIGHEMRNVTESDALDGVLGYTVANDVTARDVQSAEGQWMRAKSFDTFCPLGPVVVPAGDVADPQSLRIQTHVNGELVQDAPTSDMVFSVAELLSFCSHSFTLHPGDVLLTGTPWGCGVYMDPPRSLSPGDVVEVTVEGIGTLRNPVEAAA
jgi:5-carboxymethyl-2-hydroxymuconate isomerase